MAETIVFSVAKSYWCEKLQLQKLQTVEPGGHLEVGCSAVVTGSGKWILPGPESFLESPFLSLFFLILLRALTTTTTVFQLSCPYIDRWLSLRLFLSSALISASAASPFRLPYHFNAAFSTRSCRVSSLLRFKEFPPCSFYETSLQSTEQRVNFALFLHTFWFCASHHIISRWKLLRTPPRLIASIVKPIDSTGCVRQCSSRHKKSLFDCWSLSFSCLLLTLEDSSILWQRAMTAGFETQPLLGLWTGFLWN